MQRNEYFAQVFKQKIMDWCEINNATQQDFCQKAALNPNMITRYKQGKAYPTEETLQLMCSIFGCDVADFIPVMKKEKTLADYTTLELLAEIERRIEGRCGK